MLEDRPTSTDSKFCPVCGDAFTLEDEQCPNDGARLLLAAEDSNLVGEVLDGRYEIRSILGEGGMGVVYLAHQPTMDRDVAVKVLHPYYSKDKEALQRFLREARAASKLRHPNTIRVFDFGQTQDGLLYMVLEILRGRSLADIIDNDGRLTYHDAIDIAVQVCDALSEAHEQRIIHRDLKPDNIHIEQAHGRPNHVKLLDFGIAKMESDVRATQTGAIVGTPTYMSPEQATGADPVDGRADIYALGCIIYEMVTGVVAFQGATPLEVLVKHLNETAPPIPDEVKAEVPDALLLLIERTMAKRAGDRYPNCEALRGALQAADKAPLQAPTNTEQFFIPLIGGGMDGAPPPPHQANMPGAPPRTQTKPGAGARLSDVRLAAAATAYDPIPPSPLQSRGATSPQLAQSTGAGGMASETADLFPNPGAIGRRPTGGAQDVAGSTGPATPELGSTRAATSRPTSPGAAAPSSRKRMLSARLRPANVPLQRAGSGHRFELLMSSPDRGVLHCLDAEPPRVGSKFVLVGNDVVLRSVQLTVEVVSTEDTGGMRYINVKWIQFASSGSKQMRSAFQKILGDTISIPKDFEHLTEELWLAYDPLTTVFSAFPAPIKETRRRRQSSKRMKSVRPRRILEITSKKGNKG